jgi:hypothetical protein
MRIFLALIAIAALAACGPATQATGAKKGAAKQAQSGGAPASGFPRMNTASYRAEATTIDPQSGRTARIVQYRSGDKMRMEFPGAVTIINGATQEAFTIAEMGGQRMAMRVPFARVSAAAQSWQADAVAAATRVGGCSVAGVSGTEWAKTESDGARSTGCVTSDGILLRATNAGRTVWETTSLRRGPQDAALFTLPRGVRVMDMGSLGGMMSGMAGAQQP